MYYFLLVFHCKYISILHRFRDINTYLPKKLRRGVTLTTRTWETVCRHKNSRPNPSTKFDDSIFSHCREIYLRPRPFQGWSVVRRLRLDIVCKHTKFDDRRYFMGCEILKLVTWPWPCPFGDGWLSEGDDAAYTVYNNTKFDDSSFSRSRHSSGGVKF